MMGEQKCLYDNKENIESQMCEMLINKYRQDKQEGIKKNSN